MAIGRPASEITYNIMALRMTSNLPSQSVADKTTENAEVETNQNS